MKDKIFKKGCYTFLTGVNAWNVIHRHVFPFNAWPSFSFMLFRKALRVFSSFCLCNNYASLCIGIYRILANKDECAHLTYIHHPPLTKTYYRPCTGMYDRAHRRTWWIKMWFLSMSWSCTLRYGHALHLENIFIIDFKSDCWPKQFVSLKRLF